jgi:hypothetical protein
MEEFQKLGGLVESRWRAENYSEERFPEIAAAALAESDLPSRVDPWDIIRWVHSADTLPEQHDVEGRFGNPPVTLYSGSRFYIDVYYWLDGTTSIHQHAFCGAFQVLLGSSIHSHYNFRSDRVLSEQLSIGELSLKEVRLLKVGDIKKILPGREYIHSLFHLDRPSATITIRTQHTPSQAVQYDYRKPYIALNPFFKNVAMTKKLQTVGLLMGMKHTEADAMISELIRSSDFHTAFFVLMQVSHMRNDQMDELFGLSSGKDRFNAILEKARSAHGELADLILPVLDEQQRQNSIVQRRNTITGEEHRFFLALLLNVPNREKILELVKQRFPDVDPVEKILDWVEELSQTRVLGSKEANALGIEGFDDQYLYVLESLLNGLSAAQIREQCKKDGFGNAEDKLEKISADLRGSPIFKSLLEPRTTISEYQSR